VPIAARCGQCLRPYWALTRWPMANEGPPRPVSYPPPRRSKPVAVLQTFQPEAAIIGTVAAAGSAYGRHRGCWRTPTGCFGG